MATVANTLTRLHLKQQLRGSLGAEEIRLLTTSAHLLKIDLIRLQRDLFSSTAHHQPTTPSSRPGRKKRVSRTFADKACQHCKSQHTSQWRTGPSGPSTYVPPSPSIFPSYPIATVLVTWEKMIN